MARDWVSGEDWPSLEAALARRLELEGTAVASRALARRRGIDRAAALLRGQRCQTPPNHSPLAGRGKTRRKFLFHKHLCVPAGAGRGKGV